MTGYPRRHRWTHSFYISFLKKNMLVAGGGGSAAEASGERAGGCTRRRLRPHSTNDKSWTRWTEKLIESAVSRALFFLPPPGPRTSRRPPLTHALRRTGSTRAAKAFVPPAMMRKMSSSERTYLKGSTWSGRSSTTVPAAASIVSRVVVLPRPASLRAVMACGPARVSRDVAEMWPRRKCGRDLAEVWPRCSRAAAEVWPRHGACGWRARPD